MKYRIFHTVYNIYIIKYNILIILNIICIFIYIYILIYIYFKNSTWLLNMHASCLRKHMAAYASLKHSARSAPQACPSGLPPDCAEFSNFFNFNRNSTFNEHPSTLQETPLGFGRHYTAFQGHCVQLVALGGHR